MSNQGTETRSYHHGDLRRALLDAALGLLREGGWDFSMRELARRAGVSHSAPNKHFPTRRDLLSALAGAGFEMLRDRMLVESAALDQGTEALAATGVGYVQFAVENPALYRLMFGPELAVERCTVPVGTQAAGVGAKAVLEDAILQAAEKGVLAFSADDEQARAMAALTCWSAVHGLATLIIDGKAPSSPPARQLAGAMVSNLMSGLRKRTPS